MRVANQRITYTISLLILLCSYCIQAAEPNGMPLTAAEDRKSEEYVEGRQIVSISVFGCHSFDREFILKLLDIRTEEPFYREKIEKAIKRLERLSGIDSVQLRTISTTEGTGVRLLIIITEEDTRTFSPILSRELTNRWSYGLNFTEKNFRRVGENLRTSILLGGATIAEVKWLKTSIYRTPLLGIGYYLRYSDHTYPFPDFQELIVNDRIRRFRTALSFHFYVHDIITLSISPGMDWIEVADPMLIGQGSGNIPEAPPGKYSTLEISLGINTLDIEHYPTGGFRFIAARKDWGLLQENSKIKNFLYRMDGTLGLKVDRAILNFHSRSVITHGRVPLMLLQHLGGVGSIRGYDYGLFSGENSILGSTEIRIPLNFRDISEDGNPLILVDFHLFADGGTCWSAPESLDLKKLHSGFGCGLNFIPSKTFLLKIDVAWNRRTHGIWQIDIENTF